MNNVLVVREAMFHCGGESLRDSDLWDPLEEVGWSPVQAMDCY